MPNADLIAANPPARPRLLVSLPANLTTAMVLVDYALHGQATPTPWPSELAGRLSEADRLLLGRLRSLLAHGTNLRDFLLMRLDPLHAAHREWDALLQWLEQLEPSDLQALVHRGILSGLEFYRQHMRPDEQVEALLARLSTREPGPASFPDQEASRTGLQALLRTWGEQDPWPAIRLAEDPAALQKALIRLLTAIWEAGFEATWEADRLRMEEAIARAGRTEAIQTTEALLLRVTGLQPPAASLADLRKASQIWFLPCLHLGQSLSAARANYGWAPARPGHDTYHLFYEPPHPAVGTGPANGPEVGDDALGPSLEALGDSTRLAILQVLHRQGELFTGQVAEMLQIHQSTVSRQLAQLEQAKLVRLRKEGTVKYYTVDRDRIRLVAQWLAQSLG